MFRTKKDVDKHVRSILSKLREDEKNLRGYRISSLYYNIGEYESALEYIKRYISANDKNAAAYKVLGQCYEKLKKPDKQLEAYLCSLALDKKQNDLLIEVCRLVQNDDMPNVTPGKARYWLNLAESRNIQDPAVINLRLKLANPNDINEVPRTLESNQTLEDSFVSANGLLDDTNDRSNRDTSLASPSIRLQSDNVERLLQQAVKSIAIIRKDINDIRNRDLKDIRERVQSVEERLNRTRDDDTTSLDDYLLLNDESHQNPNDTSLMVNTSRTPAYQSPMQRQSNLARGQQQRQNNMVPPQMPMGGLNMNPLYGQMYGQMPFNPYQSPQLGGVPPMLPYNDVLNFNLQQQLLAQQMVADPRNFMSLLNSSTQLPHSSQIPAPVQPVLAVNNITASPAVSSTTMPPISIGLTTTPNSSIQKQWNTSFNNQPVERGPPVNVVITNSDRLPTNNTPSTVPSTVSFSVTIPPQHIKNNPAASMLSTAKANPSITAALIQDKKSTPSTATEQSVKSITSTITTPSTQVQSSIFGNLAKPSSSTPFGSPTVSNLSIGKTPEKPATDTYKSPFSTFSFGSATKTDAPKTDSPWSKLTINSTQSTATNGLIPQQKPSTPSSVSVVDASIDDKVEEYEPEVHFEPVIPLPDLVEVKTGEENETILFEHRAKLLRFVKETKEWKERGIGNIKLMVNKDDPNKVRLLMRREQVLKLCCNQMLSKDTKFNQMKGTANALSWFGHDYSENELQVETLAIRFRTAEICQEFHKAILDAQQKMNADCTESNKELASLKASNSIAFASASASAPAPAQSAPTDKKPEVKGFGDAFKPKAGSWTCEGCYITNKETDTKCVACASPKDKNAATDDSTKAAAPKPTFSFGNLASNKPVAPPVTSNAAAAAATAPPPTSTNVIGFGDKFKPWSCKSCYTSNAADILHCVACEEPKDDTVPKKDAQNTFSTSGKSSASTFSFGNFANAGNAKPAATATATATATTTATSFGSSSFNFSFGSPSLTQPKQLVATEPSIPNMENKQFDFVFKGKSPVKSQPNVSTGIYEDVSDDENVEEEENNTYFTPVIPLPDKVEVVTGEENEDVLYSHRAKLYRFRDKEWRERGLGDVKILRNKDSGKLRVVMRREQILKICLNHALTSDIEYKTKDPKSWSFNVCDFSEGEITPDHFSIRFKTDEIAKEFKKAIDDALAGTLQPTQNGGTTAIPSNLTAEEQKTITDLKLPADFYKFKDQKQCSGCRGCNSDEFVFPEVKAANFVQIDDNPLPLVWPKQTVKKELQKKEIPQAEMYPFGLQKSTTDTSFSSGPIFGTIGKSNNSSFSFGQTSNAFGNASGTGSIFQSTATPPQTTTPGTAQPSIFGPTATGFGTSSIFGGATNGTDPKSTTPFSFKFNSITNAETPNTETVTHTSTPVPDAAVDKTKQPTETPIFGSGSTVSFADLAKSPATPAAAAAAEPFKSATMNSFSFASLAKSTEDTKNQSSIFSSGGSFADLAKNSTNSFQNVSNTNSSGFFGLNNRDTFNNLMQPSINGNGPNKTDDNEHAVEDANYDPHYDPIIALPDEIQVSTGEENEEKLFGERAKLYRYDTTNKEWKERGVGELKILHHPGHGSYRLLLRREQIHKLVLNVAISSDLQMNAMKSSDKAYCWVAQNFAEDQQNGELEQLSVRFRNADLAIKFNRAVQDCITQLKSRGDLEPEDD